MQTLQNSTGMQLTNEQRALFEQIADCSQARSIPVFIVGGFVRDLARGAMVDVSDIDLLCEGSAEELCHALQLKLGGSVKVFSKFLTAKLIAPNVLDVVSEIDLAQARTEEYPLPGSLPVVSAATLKNDLRRRDFTINSMALPITALTLAPEVSTEQIRSKLIDPFGGAADLEARLIRALHELSFEHDPTRIMRAARYSARLGAIIEASTSNWIEHSIRNGCLATVSIERMLGECVLVACEENFKHAIAVLQQYRVFENLPIVEIGDLIQTFEWLSEALATLDLASSQEAGELLLRLSAVHSTRGSHSLRLRQLGLSNDRIKGIERDVDSACLPDIRPARTFSRIQYLLRAIASPNEEVRTHARLKLGIE